MSILEHRRCAWCHHRVAKPVIIGGLVFCGSDTTGGGFSDCWKAILLHKPLRGRIWSWHDGWVAPYGATDAAA